MSTGLKRLSILCGVFRKKNSHDLLRFYAVNKSVIVFVSVLRTDSVLGNWELVYSSQHKLAVHFLSIEDIWLSDYFFKSAMTTSLKIRVDGRRREADALYYMALARERHGRWRQVELYFIIKQTSLIYFISFPSDS